MKYAHTLIKPNELEFIGDKLIVLGFISYSLHCIKSPRDLTDGIKFCPLELLEYYLSENIKGMSEQLKEVTALMMSAHISIQKNKVVLRRINIYNEVGLDHGAIRVDFNPGIRNFITNLNERFGR